MRLMIAMLSLVFSGVGFAQNLAGEANQAYLAKEWSIAKAAYAELVAETPGNPQYLYRLAVTQRRLREFDAAIANYDAAGAAGVPPQFIDLELARLYLAQGEEQKAMEYLQAAAGNGYGNVKALEQDPELHGLSDNPAYAELLLAVRKNAAPCEYIDEMRQFDFWLGQWEVYDGTGTVKYGENSITKEDGGCFLQEKWTSAGGTPGSSINYYDPGQGRWRQHWVGAGGSIIDIYGGIVDGNMVLEGRVYTVSPPSEKPFRGTWTLLPDGRVRQFFENSDDDGETWVSWFEGFYQRIPE